MNQCIDCQIVLDTPKDIENAAICEDCNGIVCEDCIITDNEIFQCSKCFEEND